MILLRYDDVPGVIGRIGTLLGEAGVTREHDGLAEPRRGKALMVLSIDAAASPDVLASLGAGVDDAFLVAATSTRGAARAYLAERPGVPVRRRPPIFPLPSPEFVRHRRCATRHRGLRSQRSSWLLGPLFCGPTEGGGDGESGGGRDPGADRDRDRCRRGGDRTRRRDRLEAVGHGRQRGSRTSTAAVCSSRVPAEGAPDLPRPRRDRRRVQSRAISDAARSGHESGDGLVWQSAVANVVHNRTGTKLEEVEAGV